MCTSQGAAHTRGHTCGRLKSPAHTRDVSVTCPNRKERRERKKSTAIIGKERRERKKARTTCYKQLKKQLMLKIPKKKYRTRSQSDFQTSRPPQTQPPQPI